MALGLVPRLLGISKRGDRYLPYSVGARRVFGGLSGLSEDKQARAALGAAGCPGVRFRPGGVAMANTRMCTRIIWVLLTRREAYRFAT